jgi:hypothetical protein
MTVGVTIPGYSCTNFTVDLVELSRRLTTRKNPGGALGFSADSSGWSSGAACLARFLRLESQVPCPLPPGGFARRF